MIDKPVALINASPHATHAQGSLAETLTVMSARLIPEATITVPLAGRKLDANGILSDSDLSTALRCGDWLTRLRRARYQSGGDSVGLAIVVADEENDPSRLNTESSPVVHNALVD